MSNFIINRGGIWHARIKIPDDVSIHFGGRKILSKTLKTRDIDIAESKAVGVVSAWKDTFTRLRNNQEHYNNNKVWSVYLMLGEVTHKVGVSSSVDTRVQVLKRDSPVKFIGVEVFPVGEERKARLVERVVLNNLSKYNSKLTGFGGCTEFVDLDKNTLILIVKSCIDVINCGEHNDSIS